MKTLGEMTELQFRSLLLATLHNLAGIAQRSSVFEAVGDIEEYLDEQQDNEDLKLLAAFVGFSEDEALGNYYATR